MKIILFIILLLIISACGGTHPETPFESTPLNDNNDITIEQDAIMETTQTTTDYLSESTIGVR